MLHLRTMLVAFWFLAYSHSLAADIHLTRSGTTPMLLELYTSQGCSSCPPADAWINRFADAADLWKNIVPVVFHVDYWNYLGWPDVLSQKEFSTRQRQHARNGYLSSVYTPGFAVNGKEWRGYFQSLSLPNFVPVQGGTLLVQQPGTEANKLKISYRPPQGQTGNKAKYVGHLAVLGFGLQTDIQAGENRGRLLRYEFAVLSLQEAQLKLNDQAWQWQLLLPEKAHRAPRYGLAVWVTVKGEATPKQALGGFLNEESVVLLGWSE